MTKESMSTKIKGHPRHGQWHKLTGILIAVIGFFWVAKKVGWIPVAAGGSVSIWPVLTILVGIWLAFGSHRRKVGN